MESHVFGIRWINDNVVGNTPGILVNMDEGDEAVQKEIFVAVVQNLHIGYQAGISREDDLTFEAYDRAVVDRFYEEHPMDIQTDDAFRICEAGGGDETGLYEPHRCLSRKQRSVVVEVVTFHHMVDYMYFKFHQFPFPGQFSNLPGNARLAICNSKRRME